METLHHCIARIKQLTYQPVIVDLNSKALHPLLKSISDPCNLNRVSDEEEPFWSNNNQLTVAKRQSTSSSNSNLASDLRKRLNTRKKLIYSAKMKFLGYQIGGPEPVSEVKEIEKKASTSPMRALISEIRETINGIVSPERSTDPEDPIGRYLSTLRWIERPKFVPKMKLTEPSEYCGDQEVKCEGDGESQIRKTVSLESVNDFAKDFHALEKSDEEYAEEICEKDQEIAADPVKDMKNSSLIADEYDNLSYESLMEHIFSDIVKMIDVTDEEVTHTVTDDSLLPTYSLIETTETEWYYNKTIMKMDNSQTVLEIKDIQLKENENQDTPLIRNTDTGIDTDFTSEKENEDKWDDTKGVRQDDVEAEGQLAEISGLNKSSETDSSFMKSSSGGQTSNDVDTSFAFKTETENSDKTNEKIKLCASSPEENQNKLVTDSDAVVQDQVAAEKEANVEIHCFKLPDIPESPEFTNVDTEDAPITSSSKDTSPEAVVVAQQEPCFATPNEVSDPKTEEEKVKPDKKKRKRNKKSSTKITVKKEVKENNSEEPVVKEIKLTIKNSKQCHSEKYEVKIQDVTNTSEELSSSLGDTAESFPKFELTDSCSCDAQQSLVKLQGEVSTTIEKLQTIEDYFENEIQKHSTEPTGKPEVDELTIEYNYGEIEEVTNESRGINEVSVDGLTGGDLNLAEIEKTPDSYEQSLNLISSSLLIDADSNDQLNVSHVERVEFHWPDVSFGSFTSPCNGKDHVQLDETANISHQCSPTKSHVQCENRGETIVSESSTAHIEDKMAPLEAVEQNVELCPEKTVDGQSVMDSVETVDNNKTEEVNEVALIMKNMLLTVGSEPESFTADTSTGNLSNAENLSTPPEVFKENAKEECLDESARAESSARETCNAVVTSDSGESPTDAEATEAVFMWRGLVVDVVECVLGAQEIENGEKRSKETRKIQSDVIDTSSPPPDTSEVEVQRNDRHERTGMDINGNLKAEEKCTIFLDVDGISEYYNHLNWIVNRLSTPLKALTWVDQTVEKISSTEILLEHEVIEQDFDKSTRQRNASPTNSLEEFENLENLITRSNSSVAVSLDAVATKLQKLVSSPEPQKENEEKAKGTKDCIFKVVVKTPTKKEIFINYAQDSISSFDLTSDFEFCNTYVRADDVNEDFENYSSDNSAFFSVSSPEKNSGNSSFTSIESSAVNGQGLRIPFCCVDVNDLNENPKKSPRSLSIIEEVDEVDNSTSSDVSSMKTISVDK